MRQRGRRMRSQPHRTDDGLRPLREKVGATLRPSILRYRVASVARKPLAELVTLQEGILDSLGRLKAEIDEPSDDVAQVWSDVLSWFSQPPNVDPDPRVLTRDANCLSQLRQVCLLYRPAQAAEKRKEETLKAERAAGTAVHATRRALVKAAREAPNRMLRKYSPVHEKKDEVAIGRGRPAAEHGAESDDESPRGPSPSLLRPNCAPIPHPYPVYGAHGGCMEVKRYQRQESPAFFPRRLSPSPQKKPHKP
eukprot:scaffold193_cov255-Pinguiococcus_pyrenoidosus.AAC.22